MPIAEAAYTRLSTASDVTASAAGTRELASSICQQHLGGLAGRQAQRRHAADRVAGQERAERCAKRQAHAGAHAQAPCLCAKAEPQAADREDDQQPGAYAPDAIGDN
jgi:hypothetical protein